MDSNSFDEEGACADDVNKNSGDITNANNDDILKLDPSNYLTASDLCSVRRTMGKNQKNDEDAELYKGPKVYDPDENPSSDEIVDGIMSDHKKSLGLQRAVKIRECVKAVWNEELKVAIVPFLKGKASQHMGVNFKGNCALSPQEALFLLEKGSIEIEHNKVPLSVEEAYALMLKGRLSVEKYEVYSFLSQQGFIVVQHQSKIGPSYEQLINLEKRKQRKRKKEGGPNGAPPSPKRLTFTGVLSSTAEMISSPSPSSNEGAVDVCDTSGELSNDVAVDVSGAPGELSNDVAVDVSNVPGEMSNDDAVHVCSTPGEISNYLGIEDISDAAEEPSASQSSSQHIAKNLPEESFREIASLSPDSTNRIEANESYGKETVAGPQEDSHNEVSLKNSLSVEDSRKSNKSQNSVFEEMVLENTNEGNDIDVENSDTNDVIIEDDPKLDKSSEVNVDESSSDCYENDDDDDDDVSECVVPDEIESLDVNSRSPSPKILNSDSNSQSSKQTKTVDDDVTLVEVKKKEKKPLAVIDLSSDDSSDSDHHKSATADEANGKNAYEDSDDEIQVLKVCPVPGSSNLVPSRNVSCVKSESRKMKIPPNSVITKSTYRPQMKFPDLCKKDIMCLPRPPPNLLPNNVQPAKEVYVINHKKSLPKGGGRVWNSFKDMQEYQRERRRERQQSSSLNSRSGGVIRDFRSSHDSHMSQIPPFSTPDSSRDLGNQNFQMLPHMNSPSPFHGNNERPLLPTPNVFSPPGHIPFENIHNLQNLSSTDPAAFVSEIQKTVYSVASSMISTMLGQHLNLPARPNPSFNETIVGFNSHSQFSNSSQNPMFMNPPSRFPLNHSYPGDPYAASPFGADNWKPMQPHFQPRTFPPHRGPLFPCTYRNIRKKRDWRDVKAAVAGSSNMSDSGSDIEEVPINLNQILWSNDIQPLVKPGSMLPVPEVLKSLQITQKANLCDTKCLLDRYMPATTTLEITFDVYLPNSNYRRSAPTPPNIRIIVMRSADPIPRYSELVSLKRKWNDEASLQVAVVDHGDISFYNFSSMDVPQVIPFEN